MPLIAFVLVHVFNFPKEIAAGIILVVAAPSGLGLHVMSFLARANLALSVSVTAISTLLAPLITPLLMRLLAGQYVAIHFWAMVWDITQIVILPILAGLIFHDIVRGEIQLAGQGHATGVHDRHRAHYRGDHGLPEEIAC